MYRLLERILLFSAFLTLACSAPAQVTAPDFSVVALPDTQYYSESYPAIFTAQTQWIVNNQANYNIQFVLGEGDIVNVANTPAEWQNADAAVQLLDNAKIPYVLPLGNHDYDNFDPPARGTTAFNTYFGPSRYQQYSWYMGGYPSGTNDNFYAEFTVNGKVYLILALEFVPRDAALAWAKTVLDANPDKEIIVVTHSFTYTDSTRADQCSDTYGYVPPSPSGNNQGEDVWQKLLINYPNLSLVLSGHYIGNGSRRTDLGLQQNLVNEIFANYQNLTNGGDGWMRILTFRPSLNRIDVVTYSPYLNQYMTDSNDQFSITWHSTGVATTGTGTITGSVFGGSEAPSPYTCVPIAGAALTAGGVSASSNTTGAFSLSLPFGNYSLSGTAPGWATPDDDEEGAYPGYTSSAKMFLQPLLGNVAGTVTNSSGTPVSGAVIVFSGGTLPSQISVTATATGTYSAPSISEGSYTATASATGLTTATATTTVTQGQTTTLNFQLASSTSGVCTGSTVNRTVTICSPANNATVTSPVNILAKATDAKTIKDSQIYIDRVKQYQIAGGSVNTPLPLAAGTHRITVLAEDSAGSFQSTVNVTVGSTGGACAGSTVNRTVTICSPANNATVTSPVSILAQATDSAAVTDSQIYIDRVKQYQIAGSSVNTALPLAAGTHRITVLAEDKAGTFQTTVNVTMGSSGGACAGSTVNRTVTICSPANNATVTSPVSILAQATDSAAVTDSQIYVDQVMQYQIAGGSVNTSLPLAAGTHSITALAQDSAGSFQSMVNVTVPPTSGACAAPTSAGVNICLPASGATVSSPVAIQAAAKVTGTFKSMQVWIDGVEKYTETGSTVLNTTLTISAGTHRFAVLAVNTAGTKWEQAYNATVN